MKEQLLSLIQREEKLNTVKKMQMQPSYWEDFFQLLDAADGGRVPPENIGSLFILAHAELICTKQKETLQFSQGIRQFFVEKLIDHF